MKAQTEKALLSPGVEGAIKTFLEESEDVHSVVDSLTYIFNAFITTSDFDILDRVDRSNYSYDFHMVLNLMQVLKHHAQKSGYEITTDGIKEGRGAA